jgi:hypothetical protein
MIQKNHSQVQTDYNILKVLDTLSHSVFYYYFGLYSQTVAVVQVFPTKVWHTISDRLLKEHGTIAEMERSTTKTAFVQNVREEQIDFTF